MRGVKQAVSAFCKNGVSVIGHRVRCATGKDIHVRPSIRRAGLALGSGDGRWVISPDRLGPDSIVYSFGIGTDITFDLGLIRRFGCNVHAFDPTPLAIQWLKSQHLPDSVLVHHWGLAAYDGSAVFALPEKHSVSFLMGTDVPSKSVAECQVRRLPTIRELLGHEHIDLLKIDIEGAEYDALDDIVAESARINQLVVEFHHRWSGSPSRTEQAISRIEECGLRLFHVSARGLEYSFVR
jgi:FkbM family methyltransferase